MSTKQYSEAEIILETKFAQDVTKFIKRQEHVSPEELTIIKVVEKLIDIIRYQREVLDDLHESQYEHREYFEGMR